MNQLYGFISRSGICAVSGAIAGAIVGGLFGLIQLATSYPTLPRAVFLGAVLGLVLFAWLIVLLVVGVFGNYGVGAIARQSLVTSSVTGIITVIVIQTTRVALAGMLLGWLVGFGVGKLLCRMCIDAERRAD
jgi:hypothetical protein